MPIVREMEAQYVSNMWSVYRHTSPSGKVYIGITKRKPEYRWNNGKGYLDTEKDGKYKQPIFANAIIKYGWDNIKHEILLREQPEKAAKYAEQYLIRFYKMLGISYNVTDGGDGTLGVHTKRSVEYVEKMRQRVKSAGAWKGSKNPNYGGKLHTGRSGWKHTDSAKMKMSISRKGKTLNLSEETKEKFRIIVRQRCNKAVGQLDMNGNLIKTFESAVSAALFYGKGKTVANHISECCRGQRRKCLTYKWIYL